MRENSISMGHARAIINVENQEIQLAILKKIISRDLSVRQVEELVRKLQSVPENIKKEPLILPEFFVSSQDGLRETLGTHVNIRRNTNGKGHIVISFESDQDFSRILALLDK